MALIARSRYGLVAVNNDAIKDIVFKCVSDMKGRLIPCNQKGRIYKKGLLGGDPRSLNCISLEDDGGRLRIRIYYVGLFGESISDTANELFDRIENDLGFLMPEKPAEITACIKGIMSKQLVLRDIEVTRSNEQ